jgi:hypothetical protein
MQYTKPLYSTLELPYVLGYYIVSVVFPGRIYSKEFKATRLEHDTVQENFVW